jgi:HEAT repeat protein
MVLDAVGELKIKGAVPFLSPLLSYRGRDCIPAENRAVRAEVALALARLGSQEGIEYLRKMLVTPEEHALGYLGKAALCLASLGKKEHIDAMKIALRTGSKRDMLEVAEALLAIGSDESVSLLLDNLESEEWWGYGSAKLLMQYRAREAIPALELLLKREFQRKTKFLQDARTPPFQQLLAEKKISAEEFANEMYRQRFHVRCSLAIGLFEMGSGEGSASILALLKNRDEGPRSGGEWDSLFNVIAGHKLKNCIPHILPYLDDPDPVLRMYGLRCLRKLTGRQLPPVRRAWENLP